MTKLDDIKTAISTLPRQDVESLLGWMEELRAPSAHPNRARTAFTEAQRKAWLDDNRAAIEAYNARVNGGHVLQGEEDPLF
jgi:SOS response regulatory protein OraA/RecX